MEPGTSATDFVNGRNLSGKNEGVCRHRMHGRNDADVPGDGQQAGGPCHRLENPAVEVRLPSEAKPARDRQPEIDDRFIKDRTSTRMNSSQYCAYRMRDYC